MPVNLSHPTLRVPSRETPIWRYMQFPKFTSLLLSENLFFTRCTKFSDDPWEGAYPSKNFDRKALLSNFTLQGMAVDAAEKAADIIIKNRPVFQGQRKNFAISCWHINDFESDAFWRIYSRMDEGIAIRSSVGHLIDSLDQQQKRNVYLSAVTYMDYKTGVLPMSNSFLPVLYKRSSFDHEKEIRAFIWEPEASKTAPARNFDTDFGELIPIEAKKLIDEIVVSPLAPAWLVKDVDSLIRRLGYSFSCVQSDLLTVQD
jgi:hypothetical protein